MHWMYSGMAKGTSQAEVMSDSKKIKPVSLAIVKLYESEGRQAGSQSVENSVKYIFKKKISIATFWKRFGLEDCLGLVFT